MSALESAVPAGALAGLMAGQPELQPLIAAILGDGSPERRIHATARALREAGDERRAEIGEWVSRLVPVELLVPEVYAEWRPLVRESMAYIFAHLSSDRLATKLVEQVDLPSVATPVERLMTLISRMPGIQKFGQVIARNRYLEASLKEALSELENGLCDVDASQITSIIAEELGTALYECGVEVIPEIFSEASVSAVVRFTWLNPESGRRERGVFKVRKPYVPKYFAEDMTLLQGLSRFLARDSQFERGIGEVSKTVAEVRSLLEHELDFVREQATLVDAYQTYRHTPGVRVPGPIPRLSTPAITAMTEERGVKVTDALPRSKRGRERIARQLIDALIAVPLLSRDDFSLLHSDPHAGNLFYDETTREIILLDWALAERVSREARRHVALLVILTLMRDPAAVSREIVALSIDAAGDPGKRRIITERVRGYFDSLGPDREPGALDAMRLLDRLALEGVRFPTALAMFRKVLFTLDGVLHDIAGPDIRLDHGIVREFVLRLVTSYGFHHAPLTIGDFLSLEQSALFYPVRQWAMARLKGPGSRL